jgi:hypothetical protein
MSRWRHTRKCQPIKDHLKPNSCLEISHNPKKSTWCEDSWISTIDNNCLHDYYIAGDSSHFNVRWCTFESSWPIFFYSEWINSYFTGIFIVILHEFPALYGFKRWDNYSNRTKIEPHYLYRNIQYNQTLHPRRYGISVSVQLMCGVCVERVAGG